MLADPHPLALLSYVSSLLDALDPRRLSPTDRARGVKPHVSRDELIASFLDRSERETSALLAVIAAYYRG